MGAGIALKVKAPNLDALQKKLASKPSTGAAPVMGISSQPLADIMPARKPKVKLPAMPVKMIRQAK